MCCTDSAQLNSAQIRTAAAAGNTTVARESYGNDALSVRLPYDLRMADLPLN